MNKILFFALMVLFLLSLDSVYAAHFIVGKVDNSYDGEISDSHTVLLWNPSKGISDNLTDIIGEFGNSGTPNYFMIDCELLSTPCMINDNLSIKVISTFNPYISKTVNVTTSMNGYDQTPDLRLNSYPQSNNTFPMMGFNTTSVQVNFSCVLNDSDSNLKNVTLFGNWSNGWHSNETKVITGSFAQINFTKSLPPGSYKWSCLATDDLGISKYSQYNSTFTIDTPPNITQIRQNVTYLCGTSDYVRVECDVLKGSLSLNTIKVEAIRAQTSQNFSASLLSGNTYYSDIPLTLTGNYSFRCYANDTNNNTVFRLSSTNVTVNTNVVDLAFIQNQTVFSKNDTIESEDIQIISNITNRGCSKASNFTVDFYDGDPLFGGQKIGPGINFSINSSSNMTINKTWSVKIGYTNIFIVLDSTGSFPETDETNNEENISFVQLSWEEFYGNASSNKILGSSTGHNLTAWANLSVVTGNVFVTDKESQVSWLNLIALGKNISKDNSSTDFSDLDSLLGSSLFSDSISNVYTSDGIHPRQTMDFLVHGKEIKDVPYVNSSEGSNFMTGILWDPSKDTDGKFGSFDKEEIVFVANINHMKQGAYGIYDYEIKVPAKLREYLLPDVRQVYLYYDLN